MLGPPTPRETQLGSWLVPPEILQSARSADWKPGRNRPWVSHELWEMQTPVRGAIEALYKMLVMYALAPTRPRWLARHEAFARTNLPLKRKKGLLTSTITHIAIPLVC